MEPLKSYERIMLEKKLKFLKKVLIAQLVSLGLAVFFGLPLAVTTDVYVPFVIFFIAYGLISVVVTMSYSSIGQFFNYQAPDGGAGCIMVPLYLIVYVPMSFVAIFAGVFVLVSQMSKISNQLKQSK